ncbi:MAG: hypothetical protein WC570_01420 [Patescibacteria group bacterium]
MERILLTGLTILIGMYVMVMFLTCLIDDNSLYIVLILVSWLVVLGWVWYFDLSITGLWLVRRWFWGGLISLLIWLIVLSLWSMLGYGVFLGFSGTGIISKLGLFITMAIFCQVIYGQWMMSRIKLWVANQYARSLLFSVFSAAVLLLFLDISLANYLIMVSLAFLAERLGYFFGGSLAVAVLVGFMFWDSIINFILINDQWLVVGMPGPALVLVLVLIACVVLLESKMKRS